MVAALTASHESVDGGAPAGAPAGTAPAAPAGIRVEDTVTVLRVVDGDTFVARSLATGSVYKVRLADINAPELGTPEGERAKEYLAGLITGKTLYLDIDDLKRTDKYGRVVAVAYMRVNETHLVNINKLLTVEGHASIVDYSNEFNPYTWSLYVHQPAGG